MKLQTIVLSIMVLLNPGLDFHSHVGGVIFNNCLIASEAKTYMHID
jgi:hypothetical protein